MTVVFLEAESLELAAAVFGFSGALLMGFLAKVAGSEASFF